MTNQTKYLTEKKIKEMLFDKQSIYEFKAGEFRDWDLKKYFRVKGRKYSD